MDATLMQQLVDTRYCWTLTYYQSLAPDSETDLAPRDHFAVTVITSYEDQVDGWGSTADAAARDALHQLTRH